MPITRRRRANPPDQPENNNNHLAEQTENAAASLASERDSATSAVEGEAAGTGVPNTDQTVTSFMPPVPPTPVSNGADQQNYTPPIEGGRRTSRGELFRRPPQQPPSQLQSLVPNAANPPLSAPVQPPTHEISLPLGNLLHLAYNPGYTGAEEARSALLQQLESQSKAGGRARCWNCGSIAIAYDRWNTRSKTFGEVGIAYCEICGVWSVL
ncbi:MAG: hypothetical protein E6J21_03925 [Chloroflexota bacterium]|nr:MAG: hypothetical protein E6J21_03925 [Chloroflexota bacterium]